MYLVMLWVVLVVSMMGLPFELLSIAGIIIAIPIIIAPLTYKSAKERFGTLQEAGLLLKGIEESLNESNVTLGLTSYIFLIFDVIRPTDVKEKETSDNEVEKLRKHVSGLTMKVIFEVIFHGTLYTILIINFLIPEFISAIEQGSPLLLPLVFLAFVIAILIARWFIFFYWRLLVRRWLRFYQGFVAWGEDLERLFSKSTDETGGVP
jgi:hypothetical protein